jgi:hypothetical protein
MSKAKAMVVPLMKEQKTSATIAETRMTSMTDFPFHRYGQASAVRALTFP